MGFRVLGALEVSDGSGAPVSLRSAKQRRLLAALLVRAGHAVSADRLAEVLWGDEQPADPAGAMQTFVSRLRAALRSAGAGEIVTRPGGYLLEIKAGDLDAAVFARLATEAHAVQDERPLMAAALLDEALGLWRGPPYMEFAGEEFVEAESARLDGLRLTAEGDRVEVMLALGRHDEAVRFAEELIAEDPLRERPRAQLMLARYRAGRTAEALETYRDYRGQLAAALGLDPSPELRDLEAAIIRQDPRLAPTAPSSLGNLPLEVVDLVGRSEDAAWAAVELARGRLVTFTGTGGVGKTSLALRVAWETARGYPDGVWWCELAPVTEDGVTDALVAVLGIRPREGVNPTERVVEYLRPKHLLLVLDNCEHVLDEAARLASAIVRGCPRVTVLATSRAPLGLASERVLAVSPLAVPPQAAGDPEMVGGVPSVALFVERAAAASPSFRLTPGNAEAVSELCRRLDGLPLALELAAGRTRSMTPAEIVDRLGGRLRFLRTATRAGTARHRTLQAVIDWSYDLLDGRHRQVFCRLSVFAGPFTLDAAASVAGEGSDVASEVADLVDRSMLVAHLSQPPARYTLLETLRAYGRERLAEQSRCVEAAHARYHVELAEAAGQGLLGPDERAATETIASCFDDLRAAHRWAVEHDLDLALRLSSALHWYVDSWGPSEVAAWAERAVAAASGRTHPLLPVALASAATGARDRGNLVEAARLAHRGMEAAGDPADPVCRYARYVLADVAMFEGRLDESECSYAEAARLAERAGDTWTLAYAVVTQACPAAYRGDERTAIALADRARALAAEIGNSTLQAWADYATAEALLESDPIRALSCANSALSAARANRNDFLAGIALVSAACLQSRSGDPGNALELFGQVIEHWHRFGNRTQQWITLRNVVDLLTRLGWHGPAAVLYGALAERRTGAPAFGADAERLAAAVTTLRARLGDYGYTEALTRGAKMTDDEAVSFAITLIDKLARVNA